MPKISLLSSFSLSFLYVNRQLYVQAFALAQPQWSLWMWNNVKQCETMWNNVKQRETTWNKCEMYVPLICSMQISITRHVNCIYMDQYIQYEFRKIACVSISQNWRRSPYLILIHNNEIDDIMHSKMLIDIWSDITLESQLDIL